MLSRARETLRPWLAALTGRRATSGERVVERYSHLAPHPQRTLDLFKGEWSSRLPEPLQSLDAGGLPLFGDPRLLWAAPLLDLCGRRVLELGPLEGGHSWMMTNLGASSVTAVESNPRAFLKCLVLKELLEIQRVNFLFGDCLAYLEEVKPRFDIVVASGILYHMKDPVRMIDLMSRAADRVYIWTHYYDPEICGSPLHAGAFSSTTRAEHGGFEHTLYRHEYLNVGAGFCGGGSTFSNWITQQAIFDALRHFGLGDIQTGFHDEDHASGPAFAVVASRRQPTGAR